MIFVSLDCEWEMRRSDENSCIKAHVPGSVYSTLLEKGKIQDPFYRDNEYQIKELSNYDYQFKR